MIFYFVFFISLSYNQEISEKRIQENNLSNENIEIILYHPIENNFIIFDEILNISIFNTQKYLNYFHKYEIINKSEYSHSINLSTKYIPSCSSYTLLLDINNKKLHISLYDEIKYKLRKQIDSVKCGNNLLDYNYTNNLCNRTYYNNSINNSIIKLNRNSNLNKIKSLNFDVSNLIAFAVVMFIVII